MPFSESNGTVWLVLSLGSPFQQAMTLEIYQKIVNVLVSQSLFINNFAFTENHIEEFNDFFKKHKRNFLINKNSSMPRYILKQVDGKLEKFSDEWSN